MHKFEMIGSFRKEKLDNIVDAASSNGIEFCGDLLNGSFSGRGIVGQYSCSNGKIKIVIIKKPFYIPASLIAKTIGELVG